MKYDIDRKFKIMCVRFPFNRPFLAVSNLFLRIVTACTPCPKGIKKSRAVLGNVKCSIFVPSKLEGKKMPVLVYYHGGGFGHLAAPHQKRYACRYALGASCAVVMPLCARIPKHRYTKIIGDAVSAYNAACLLPQCDGRVAVMGDSAGGFQAGSVSVLGDRKPTVQLLIYPVTDCEKSSPSMQSYTDTPMWNAKNDRNMWSMLVDENTRTLMQLPVPDVETYIEVAQFDPLHDQGEAYAARLRDAGVRVTFTDTKGTVHGFDFIKSADISKKCIAARIEALRKSFKRS